MPWRVIERHAEHRPEAVAIRFAGGVLTYGAFAAVVRRAAAGLAALGVRRGDRVAFLGTNHPAQLVALFGLLRLGAMLVPLNWRLAVPELRHALTTAGAGLLLAMPDFAGVAAEAAPMGCVVRDATATWDAAPDAPAVGGEDDPALLVFTSGTTGRPKAAVLDGRALLFTALNGVHMHDLTAADHVLTVLPLFHVGGLNIQTLPALYAGASVTLHPRFEAGAFLRACAEERPTLSLLVPAVMAALVAHPGWAGADLASLRAVGAGSADVPVGLIRAFLARGVPVQQVYGATETGPSAVYQTREEAIAAPGSIGRVALHAEARVVGADGAPRPVGEAGEIQVRGPGVTRGYWGDPAASAAALRDGWFSTGDVGRVDPEGRWWFTDRIKDVIISGGENVYPAEVERVLASAPGVIEGAVCGRADARWGEVPVAVVVAGPGFSRDAVLGHVAGELARFKRPRDVVVVERLPRNAMGKVERAALRALGSVVSRE